MDIFKNVCFKRRLVYIIFMKKKKHQFHCNHCGSPCEIYKKGKGHRVLVCPYCGVLATNPTFAGKLLRGAVRSIPVVGGVASSVIEEIQESKPTKIAPATRIRTHRAPDHYYEEKALGGN